MNWYEYENVSDALPALANEVMQHGEELGSRGGERVMELMHPHIVLTEPLEREVTHPVRKASLPAQIAETMWVLSGRDDIGWLSHYLPRAPEFSDDGRTWRGAYGPRLRRWQRRGDPDDVMDQLALAFDLLKRDRTTRRAVLSIYDPDVDAAPGKDIPCNDMLHFTSRLGWLDLHVFTRSNDLIWGWSGINAFEWSVLLEIMAGMLGVAPGRIHFSISSLHIYDRHWKRAGEIGKLTNLNDLYLPSPRFDAEAIGRNMDRLDSLFDSWFEAEKIIRNAPGSEDAKQVIRAFPERMLKSWLAVLAWWWSGDEEFLAPYDETALAHAARLSPRRNRAPNPAPEPDEFNRFITRLHADKHAAYGDSWKRRGESIGILANIARKVDRLGVAGAGDTSADTAIDLLVYLVKYRLWLIDRYDVEVPEPVKGFQPAYDHGYSDYTVPVEQMLEAFPREEYRTGSVPAAIEYLTTAFDHLETAVEGKDAPSVRRVLVDDALPEAYKLARTLWLEEQGAAAATAAYTFWKDGEKR